MNKYYLYAKISVNIQVFLTLVRHRKCTGKSENGKQLFGKSLNQSHFELDTLFSWGWRWKLERSETSCFFLGAAHNWYRSGSWRGHGGRYNKVTAFWYILLLAFCQTLTMFGRCLKRNWWKSTKQALVISTHIIARHVIALDRVEISVSDRLLLTNHSD